MVIAPKYSAPALDKGLEILEFLSAKASPQSQSEIANGVGRSSNEIYRVIMALEAKGYIVRPANSVKYSLTLKLYTLAHTHSPIEQLRFAAHLPMHELAQKIGQSCHLSVPYNDQLLVVSQIKSPEPVSISISEGTLFPLVNTASGKVLLAHFSEERCQFALSKDEWFASCSAHEKTNFYKQLQDIRDKGYFFGPSEITVGITDCAVFVGQADVELMAVIAVSSLSTRIGRKLDETAIIDASRLAGSEINSRIGLGVKSET